MKRLAILLIAALICVIPTYNVEAASYYSFYEENTNTLAFTPYVGEVCGVKVYGTTPDQWYYLNIVISNAANTYDLKGLTVVVDNWGIKPLEKIHAFGSDGQWYLSQNVCLDALTGSVGEYRENGDIILLSGAVDVFQLQLNFLHELGHRVDFANNRPSDNLTATQIALLRYYSEALCTPCISNEAQYTRFEAFAELIMLQQCGVLPM